MGKYNRILIKLSGEALAGETGRGFGIDPVTAGKYAKEIKEVYNRGIEMGIVIGGGNFFRARMAPDMDRVDADKMGMMATVINSLALRDYLEKAGVPARVMSSKGITDVAEPFVQKRAVKLLENKKVLIFAGGTGSPYFTTDTSASLKALEIGADILMKATRVDGVYDKDPEKEPSAKRFSTLSYIEVLQRRLQVMDLTAISLCMENRLPLLIFNISTPCNLLKAIEGEPVGTLVGD